MKLKSIRDCIARKTKRIRYKFLSFVMKRLTPILYKEIDDYMFRKKGVFQFNISDEPIVIRPSIKFIKELSGCRMLIGAEIGVQRGINSESILNELNIKKMYLIDAWKSYADYSAKWTSLNYDLVKRRFKNDERVEIIKGFSEVAVNNIKDGSLDFVYIDANHTYEYVFQDINLWFPKVKFGGIVAGHDVCVSDVIKAVRDFCSDKNIDFQIDVPDWYFVKPNFLECTPNRTLSGA